MPSATQIRCTATSVHSTTVRSPGTSALSLAAAEAPVANTLSTRSAGCRSSSARRAGTSLARGAPVHAVRQPAPGPKVGEVQPVVQAGDGDQAVEQPVRHARRSTARAVTCCPGGGFASPDRSSKPGTAARHHLVAEPQRPGQQHRVLHHVTSWTVGSDCRALPGRAARDSDGYFGGSFSSAMAHSTVTAIKQAAAASSSATRASFGIASSSLRPCLVSRARHRVQPLSRRPGPYPQGS